MSYTDRRRRALGRWWKSHVHGSAVPSMVLEYASKRFMLNLLNKTFDAIHTTTAPGLSIVRDADGNLKWRGHNKVDNPEAPVTQSITVTSGATYTVSCAGSGSVALSGAGTGTVTDGNPVEIAASTTSLTLTVSGSLDAMWAYRSDMGGMVLKDDGTTYYPAGAGGYIAPRYEYEVISDVAFEPSEFAPADNLISQLSIEEGDVWAIYQATGTALDNDYFGEFPGLRVASSGSTIDRVTTKSGQQQTLTAGEHYAFSVYVVEGTSGECHVQFYTPESGGLASVLSEQFGSLWQTIDNAGPITGVKETDMGGGITKVSGTFTPDVSGVYTVGVGPNSTTVGEDIIAIAFYFGPETSKTEPLGLLTEEQSTTSTYYLVADLGVGWVLTGAAGSLLSGAYLGAFPGVLLASAGQVWHRLDQAVGARPNVTAGNTYPFSVFVKEGTSGKCRIVFRSPGRAVESIVEGSFGSLAQSSALVGTITDIEELDAGFGITEVRGVLTPNTTEQLSIGVGPNSATSGEDITFIGLRVEDDRVAVSSPIPAFGALTTRAQDLREITDMSWWDSEENTFVVSFKLENAANADRVLELSDGTSSNRISVLYNASEQNIQVQMFKNGVYQAGRTSGPALTFPVEGKLAVRVAEDNFAVSFNGEALGKDTSCEVPNITKMTLATNHVGGAQPERITHAEIVSYPEALIDATVQELSSV